MPLAFYMDAHVPSAITFGLRQRGVDVLTSQQDGTRRLPDAALLERSTALGRLLVTQDEDFLAIAAARAKAGHAFVGLIFAPQGQAGIGRYIDDLELIAECCEPTELANRVEYLPLR